MNEHGMNPVNTNTTYLPAGLPVPLPEADGLSTPYWDGLRARRIMVQRCAHCSAWQWGPEWICHACHRFDPAWTEIKGEGVIQSFTRVWHPVHPALDGRGAYLAVVVGLPHAGGIRMVGNLLGDAHQQPVIGGPVRAVFEDHDGDPPFTLLQWQSL